MSGQSGIWRLLEIEPTSDVRKIKRAYAKQAAKYHPEEFPEEFQQIRQAYESAILLAKSESHGQDEFVVTDFVRNAERQETVPVSEDESPEDAVREDDMEADSGYMWKEAERISELAEKYATEEEVQKRHDSLYRAFLIEIALEKLDSFLRTGGIQPHNKWCSYVQEPVFIEAVHDPYFLTRLTDRIGVLTFQKRTRLRIREVLEKEIPEELSGQKKLQLVLNGKRLISEKDRQVNRSRKAGLLTICCIVLLVSVLGIRNDLKQKKVQEFRAPDKIEKYIAEKYQISCTLSESEAGAFNRYGVYTAKKESMDYYLAETNGESGVPEYFHLSWAVSSMDYDDIMDDLEYETVSMYAKEYGFTLGLAALGNTNVINMPDTSLEEFVPRFLEFLNAVKESRIVQSGSTVKIKVQEGIVDYDNAGFYIDKESEISEEEVRTKVEDYLENSLVFRSKQQFEEGQ